GLAPADIKYEYQAIKSLTLDTGAGGVGLQVTGTGSSLIINLAGASNVNNTVNVGGDQTSGSLDPVKGAVTVHSVAGPHNTLTLSDLSASAGQDYTFDTDNVSQV